MADDVVVTIAEFRLLANRLCDAIEARGKSAARVERRHYWSVFFDDMLSLDRPQPVIGDFADDLQGARHDLLEKDKLPVIWHPAHHLAGLLNLIARADSTGTLE